MRKYVLEKKIDRKDANAGYSPNDSARQRGLNNYDQKAFPPLRDIIKRHMPR